MGSEDERIRPGNSVAGLSNLQMRALNDSFTNLMNAGLEQIHLRLDEIQNSQQPRPPTGARRDRPRRPNRSDDEIREEDSHEDEDRSINRPRRGHRNQEPGKRNPLIISFTDLMWFLRVVLKDELRPADETEDELKQSVHKLEPAEESIHELKPDKVRVDELYELSELSDITLELDELSDTEDGASLVAGRNGPFSAHGKIHNKFNLGLFYSKFDQAFGDGLLPICIKKYQ
uniref:Uncharacterized protein n=1 Tax=Brassica campestris TaxID=3711 RepID=M4F5P3_BRACM